MTDALIEREQAAIKALLDYGQADMDGIIVTTSRQAIHEVVDALKAKDAALAAKDAEIERLQSALSLYGDRARMSRAPAQLQETIDRAMATAYARAERVDDD